MSIEPDEYSLPLKWYCVFYHPHENVERFAELREGLDIEHVLAGIPGSLIRSVRKVVTWKRPALSKDS